MEIHRHRRRRNNSTVVEIEEKVDAGVWLNRVGLGGSGTRIERVDGEEEESHAGGCSGSAMEMIVLEHHVVEVVVVGDGDEGVETLAGELVLEEDVACGVEEGGELGEHGGELDAAVDVEDLGVAADVGELVVVVAGLDLAAVAAHEFCLVVLHLLFWVWSDRRSGSNLCP